MASANAPPGVLPLDAERFGAVVCPGSPRHRAVRQLFDWTTAATSAQGIEQRGDALERLAKWVRSGPRPPSVDGAPTAEPPATLRLRVLGRAMAELPEVRSEVARLLATTLNECSGVELLANAGIPGDRTFLAETVDRLSRRFLPEPVDERNLAQLMARLFPRPKDLAWLRSVPVELVSSFIALSTEPERSPWTRVNEMTRESLALLSTRIAAVGLSEPLRTRSPEGSVTSSPFFRLPRACDALCQTERVENTQSLLEERRQELELTVAECRTVMDAVVGNLEERGVSVDVVYRLELISAGLTRLSELSDGLVASPPARHAQGRDLLVGLLAARLDDRSLAGVTSSNLHLLARKIIERAGHTGEHYITTTRGEYFGMLLSAGGGGVLTAGTTTLKYTISNSTLPLFVEGMLSAANYAGSFLLMQGLGFTLATKQPSMTAAALAGSLERSTGHPDLAPLVTTIARITRSQLAAALGNIGLVIPAAYAVNHVHVAYLGRPILTLETAEYVLHSLHPLESGTVFYATLTGVLLWMSSIVAGWLENWAAYRRLGEAIREHRIGRFVGRRTMAWISRVFSRNISGVGGNSALGLLLGMTPVMGKFVGIPLDVRHVTLSTGALTLAAVTLGPATFPAELAWAGLGIVVIGALNFGVSFLLALLVALRARNVRAWDALRLFGLVVLTFFRSPMQFVFPPKGTTPPAPGGH